VNTARIAGVVYAFVFATGITALVVRDIEQARDCTCGGTHAPAWLIAAGVEPRRA